MPKLAARFNPKMMNRRQKVNLDWGYDISQLRPITDRNFSQQKEQYRWRGGCEKKKKNNNNKEGGDPDHFSGQ